MSDTANRYLTEMTPDLKEVDLQTILIEAAWRWIPGDLGAAKTYHRLVSNSGSAKKAIVAMARKIGIVL
jgi:hypothetical protein